MIGGHSDISDEIGRLYFQIQANPET